MMATSTSQSPPGSELFGSAKSQELFNQTAIKNCAAAAGMAASMYWPTGLDTPYSYSSANALAAAVTSMAMNGGANSSVSTSINASASSVTPPGLSATDALALGMASGYNSIGAASMVNPVSMLASSGVTRSFAHSTTPTPKKKATPVPTHLKDNSYWDRRKKNNESARRSRESRRIKEEQIALRVVYLEQENLQLKTECQMLKLQIDKLTMMMYGSNGVSQQR